LTGNANNQLMSANWKIPNKLSSNKSEINVLSSLSDCDMAIQINNSLGFAYYIRGQIKQMLRYEDYCIDLLAAKEFGMIVDEELLGNCRK